MHFVQKAHNYSDDPPYVFMTVPLLVHVSHFYIHLWATVLLMLPRHVKILCPKITKLRAKITVPFIFEKYKSPETLLNRIM